MSIKKALGILLAIAGIAAIAWLVYVNWPWRNIVTETAAEATAEVKNFNDALEACGDNGVVDFIETSGTWVCGEAASAPAQPQAPYFGQQPCETREGYELVGETYMVDGRNCSYMEIVDPPADEPEVEETAPVDNDEDKAKDELADSGNDNDDDVNTNDGECVTVEWFNEQVESTDTVSELLSELDREYNLNNGDIGGMWTQEQVESDEGYTVPAGSEFHTDLFENVKELPDGVNIVRSQGGWGIYSTSVDYEIPLPNGGGRWITICGEVDNDDAAGGSSSDNPQACLAESDLNNITGGNSPVDAFNEYFESAGWAYGGELDKGETIPEGVVFLGTFPESNIPEGVVNLSDGFIWEVSESVKAPSGGRYVMACGE